MLNVYPLFENGQVLTSKHLNDLAGFLAEQDRLTRRKLIGIGIVCGLEVDYPSEGSLLRIGAGTAVTSEGHLIVVDECRLGHYRPYTPPAPAFEEIPKDLSLAEEAPYPFFLNGAGAPIPLWELFAEDYIPAPGEPELTPIGPRFLGDKVVLLFLECLESALKSCELHDCSDKGAQLTFTVRKLLVRQSDAQAMLDREGAIATRPVDLHTHPKYDLKPLVIARINSAGQGLATFEDLYRRVLDIFATDGPQIVKALQAGYEAYAYLLADIYPPGRFPDGPFGDTAFILKGLENLGRNVFLVQYLYDLLYDLVQSHNEFLDAASRLEGECCPHPARFPKHVLLGLPDDRPQAFDPPKPNSTFDPLDLDAGFGARTRPTRFRHHFIPAMIFDRQDERLERVRALHYRTFLLAYRYTSDDLFNQPIRITPSRDGDVNLSAKAIPFYYAFKADDDLHRNWAFDATSRNWLEQIHAHRFTRKAGHPLLDNREAHDFYRIEGIVGEALGDAMQNLLTQKQALGLSFGVEPVYVGLSLKDDPSSILLDKEVRGRLQQALWKLLLCRFRDLDVVFLVLMMALFFFLYVIIARLAGLGLKAVALLPRTAVREVRTPTAAVPHKSKADRGTLIGDKLGADTLLQEIRQKPYVKGGVTAKLRPDKDPEASIGGVYEKIAGAGDENLYDRTLKYARTLDLDAKPEEIANNLYPTISLIDKSEEMIRIAGAASIADIDLATFEQKVAAFEIAYDAYLGHAGTTNTKDNPEIAGAHETLTHNRGQLEAGGSVTLINSMLKEFQTRMTKIFSELILAGYAGRHPGMAHKCGVPKGGTLILLYTHRNLIRQVLGKNKDRISSRIETVYTQFGYPGTGPIFLDPDIILPAGQSSADPLNDFVVLGDFCLPYLCCDTDCSDIVLTESGREIPRKGIASGRVFGIPAGSDVRTGKALDRAVITVTHADSGETVPVQTVGEAFSFIAPAGIYRIQVKHPEYRTTERLVSVRGDGPVLENFVLDQPSG